MVILSHIAFACFAFLFNNVIKKVWTKKMHAIGKENIRQILVGNLHNTVFIHLQAELGYKPRP